MMKLMASLKEKKRYLVFEVIVKGAVSFEGVKNAISDAIVGYIGVKGTAEAGLIFLKDYYKGKKGFFRVSAKKLDDVKAALMFVKKIDGKEVIVKPIFVSGLINKAKEKVE